LFIFCGLRRHLQSGLPYYWTFRTIYGGKSAKPPEGKLGGFSQSPGRAAKEINEFSGIPGFLYLLSNTHQCLLFINIINKLVKKMP
jgi:hypothetical protein